MTRLSRALLAGAAGLAMVAAMASPATAYQPAQQTLYTAQNASSCNKSPCILYPKSAQLPGGRLVAAFEDSEGPVSGQTMPIYKSDDNGETWQKLTNLAAPAPYTSEWTNPYLYVLPQAVGSLAAGTLLLASVVSGDADGDNNRQNLAIVLHASTDQGATWQLVSTIATGPDQAQDPVWEPYLMMYQGQLVAYYSDENDYSSYDTSTGVGTISSSAENGGQVLVHRTWSGSGAWSSPVLDVIGSSSSLGTGRPGMTNVVPTTDGKWLLTYEYWGGGDNVRYKIASNPLQFYATGGAAGTGISALTGGLAKGGSPVLLRRPDGSLVYNAAGSADVWVNETGRSDGAWKQYHTAMPAGYSRDLQYVTGTGQLEILQAPWGTGPVSYGQLDLGNSTGVYYALVNRSTGQVLAPQSGKTQDAAFTGDVPDIVTADRDDSNAGQWWHLARKGTSVTLLNSGGGRAAGIWQGSATAGAKLTQWVDDNAADKLWNLVPAGDGYYKLQSSKNTTLYATAATAGGAVDIEAASTSTAQQWQLVADFGTTANAYFKLVNHNSGKVLGIYQGSTADGAAAVQWADNGNADQNWNLTRNSAGNLVLTDRGSGKVLTATSATALTQATGTGAAGQQWTLTASGAYYTVRNASTGLYLGVLGGSTADGAAAVQWTGNGSADQQWQLVQVSGM